MNTIIHCVHVHGPAARVDGALAIRFPSLGEPGKVEWSRCRNNLKLLRETGKDVPCIGAERR